MEAAVRSSLVERARGGDHAAFDALVDLDADRCLAIAYRITEIWPWQRTRSSRR